MSYLPPARQSWQRGSKFRENLSALTVPDHSLFIEKSKFSPDSPRRSNPLKLMKMQPPPPPPVPTNPSPRSLESGQTASRPGLTDRIRNFLWELRTWGRSSEPESCPPLHINKKVCPCQEPKERRRRRIWLILLILLLIYLLGNTILLNVRVLRSQSGDQRSPSNAPPSGGNLAATLSADAQQCLSQFTLNAPGNPSTYPCSSCLPILQSIPSAILESNPSQQQDIQNAVQFCGLKALFDSANSAGMTSLSGGNWVQDIRFCAWSGVSCDGSGQVSSIQLTFPAVPASIPEELGALSGLQTLQIVGDGNVPGGSLPSSFSNLTSLSLLHLESTGMNALPDGLFSSLTKISTLTLVKNAHFGGGLPSTVTGLSLQSLIVNGQSLNTPLSTILSSPALQSSLRILDLSATGLSTAIPSTISSFRSLTELHLQQNNIQPPIPTALPPSLTILDLSNNTALSGTLPASLCTNSALQSCNLRSTGLGSSGNCGPCQF